jgi:hypothetical protein
LLAGWLALMPIFLREVGSGLSVWMKKPENDMQSAEDRVGAHQNQREQGFPGPPLSALQTLHVPEPFQPVSEKDET